MEETVPVNPNLDRMAKNEQNVEMTTDSWAHHGDRDGSVKQTPPATSAGQFAKFLNSDHYQSENYGQ